MRGWEHDLPEALVVTSRGRDVLCARVSRNLRGIPEVASEDGRRRAAAAGVSKQSLSSYLKGSAWPSSLLALARVSLLSGLDMMEVLGDRPLRPSFEPDATELLAELSRPIPELKRAYSLELTSLLESRGMSMRGLARDCGMPHPVVVKLASGFTLPAACSSLLLASALGASPLEMLLGESGSRN